MGVVTFHLTAIYVFTFFKLNAINDFILNFIDFSREKNRVKQLRSLKMLFAKIVIKLQLMSGKALFVRLKTIPKILLQFFSEVGTQK